MSSECTDKTKLGDRVHRISVHAEAEDDTPICWVCLDHATLDKPLIHPCKCPSWCHSTCIARWQLQSAGTRREKYCDFCSSELPDWKSVLTPVPGATAPAVMNVNFDNKTYSFQVAPGAEGYRQFTEAIRKAFHLPEDSELNITFTCDEPSSGSLLTLSGPGAYDAAVHCASVSAARRSMSGDSSSSSSSSSIGDGTGPPAGHPNLNQQQQQQGLRPAVHSFGSFVGGEMSDAVERDDQVGFAVVDYGQTAGAVGTTATTAGSEDVGGGYHDEVQRSGGSNSSSQSYQHGLGRTASSSSEDNDSGRMTRSMIYSPATSNSSTGQRYAMQDVHMPAADEATAAAAAAPTHYDPTASPPAFHSGGASLASMDDDLGFDCSAAAAAVRHEECSRPPSAASSSSGVSSSGNSLTGRRGSGFGKKLRDVISDLLVSK